jgi:hypothetical protein
MLFVPKEIFSSIDADNISLFLTCKFFYQFVDVFYRKVKFDGSRCVVNGIVRAKLRNVHLLEERCHNVYNLTNADFIPDIKFLNIKYISFGHSFNETLDGLNYLSSVESITFGISFNQAVDNLPTTLTSLSFLHYFNKAVDNLPTKLKSLTFGDDFNQSLDNLPATLTTLTFGHNFNKPVDYLPEKLISLTFGATFNQSVNNLPKTLTSLTFEDTFNQSVDDLPKTLTSITFGDTFNQSVDNLPKTLTSITFGDRFNQKLIFKNFPFLTFLQLHESYDDFIDLEDCPLTLEKIIHGFQHIDLNIMRKGSPIIRYLA